MDNKKQITRLIAVALMGLLAFLAITAHSAKTETRRQRFYCCTAQEMGR